MILRLERPKLQRFRSFPVKVVLKFHIREVRRWERDFASGVFFSFLLSIRYELSIEQKEEKPIELFSDHLQL